MHIPVAKTWLAYPLGKQEFSFPALIIYSMKYLKFCKTPGHHTFQALSSLTINFKMHASNACVPYCIKNN